MTTVERIWGRKAMDELRDIELSPGEQRIQDLVNQGYSAYIRPLIEVRDPLPAVYRNIKIP